MASRFARIWDLLRSIGQGGPGICNIAVTNVCNARCDFCNYAYDKPFVTDRAMVEYSSLCEALEILHGRGIRYLTFSGGEPLLHPRIVDMVAHAVQIGMKPSICTNGFLLRARTIDALASAGLRTVIISIDGTNARDHEQNRGLEGVCARILEANRELKSRSIETLASVTINKLIDDFESLPRFLESLGFSMVTFSYPKRALGSSSLVFSETSPLVHYSVDELVGAFESIKRMKKRFPILNPSESLSEMIRFVKKEPQMHPCFGGYKYFFLDWKLDVYRCDYWPTKMGTIQEFRALPFIRDNCTACMSDCYRDSSVLLEFAVALGDALDPLRRRRPIAAARTVFRKKNARSLIALLSEWGQLRRLRARA
jgi:MoaA/NifB/PqqE/SkfB family radical SAM enzyme